MNKIGSGLQYNVYDLNNGRVLKKTRTRKERFIWWSERVSETDEKIEKRCDDAEKDTKESTKRLKKILQQKDYSLCGNPRFLEDSEYEQDKLMPLCKYFSQHSLEENKKIIDGFIQCTLKIWGLGFADKVFNFTINNGVNKDDNVVLIDLGELIFSKKELIKVIRDKIFLTSWSYGEDIEDKRLQEYYHEQALKFFTLEAVNTFWKQV